MHAGRRRPLSAGFEGGRPPAGGARLSGPLAAAPPTAPAYRNTLGKRACRIVSHMPQAPTPHELREMILQIAHEREPHPQTDAALDSGTVLQELRHRIGNAAGPQVEKWALSAFHDLMRTGHFAWGHDFTNCYPPKFHITPRGAAVIENLSRDPGNPRGYLQYVHSVARLSDVAAAYLEEGVACYIDGRFRAAAVMLGAGAESMLLEVRDVTVARLTATQQQAPAALNDWKPKTVLDALAAHLGAKRNAMPHELREAFEAHFLSIAGTIRVARNDAGHPATIAPVTEESVHASFLQFSTLAAHYTQLGEWIRTSLP